jgi:hypothetical protein
METFNTHDLEVMQSSNIRREDVEKQLDYFRRGFPAIDIIRNVTVDDGIRRVEEDSKKRYVERYENTSKSLTIQKFVPASGAATRMFKSLFSYLSATSPSISDHPDVEDFMINLKDFAFYDDLARLFDKSDRSLEEALAKEEYSSILHGLLEEDGLNYGFLPKGLIKFHRYDDVSRTAAEEHLVEAAEYAVAAGRKVYIHFTVSPQHRAHFDGLMDQVKDRYEKMYDVTYEITYSEQNPGTDTIAVDFNNNPFRDENDEILFRPGGHGALLENLNNMDSDIVMIKNIDNVVPDHLKPVTIEYKKVLGGVLLEVQEKLYGYQKQLDEQSLSADLAAEIVTFLKEEVFYVVSEGFAGQSMEEKQQQLKEILQRPIRVCGMVINTGAPGGGPFWVRNSDGSVSLQIVESAQIDMDNPTQKQMMEDAGYFNPTDVICGLKNYKGESYNLMSYRDNDTGFITEKSLGGKKLKALELPGLWNGSMANWNTIFVEVPAATFNPVKSVNDLLKQEHQPVK